MQSGVARTMAVRVIPLTAASVRVLSPLRAFVEAIRRGRRTHQSPPPHPPQPLLQLLPLSEEQLLPDELSLDPLLPELGER